MAGYIGSKSSVTLVDGYSEAEADAEFVTKTGDTMTGNLTVQGTVAATAVTGDGSGLTGTGSPSIVDNGNATAMTITSDENVGIGVTPNAAYKMQVNVATNTVSTGSPAASSIANISGGTATVGDGVSLQLTNTSGAKETAWRVSAVTASGNNGDLVFNGYAGGADYPERMRINSSGKVGIGGDPNSGKKLHIEGNDTSVGITLKDTAGQQMAILSDDNNLEFKSDSSGNVFCQMYGTTGAKSFGSFEHFSGGYNIYVGAGSAASYGIRIDGAGTGSAGILQVVNGYGQVGSISVSGASTSFNTSSDYRLKTDVQPMTGASARVQALNPVNFEWIADGNRTDGFLAHEAQEVVPEAITGIKDAMKDEPCEVTPAVEATYDDDGNELTAAVEAVMGTRSVPDYQGIDQSKLVPLLTAALQEALTEIASLKTRVEALEA